MSPLSGIVIGTKGGMAAALQVQSTPPPTPYISLGGTR
jgi:hypothetical protein